MESGLEEKGLGMGLAAAELVLGCALALEYGLAEAGLGQAGSGQAGLVEPQ